MPLGELVSARTHEPRDAARLGIPNFQDAGYVTCLFGMWHPGVVELYHPLKHGFDGVDSMALRKAWRPDMIKGGGHFMQETRGVELAELIVKFIQDNPLSKKMLTHKN